MQIKRLLQRGAGQRALRCAGLMLALALWGCGGPETAPDEATLQAVEAETGTVSRRGGAPTDLPPRADRDEAYYAQRLAPYMDQARSLAETLLIVDTHVDAPFRMIRTGEDLTQETGVRDFDYPRAQRGGLDAPFMAIYIPADVDDAGQGLAMAHEQIDLVEAMIAKAQDDSALATCVADVRALHAAGIMALPMGLENGGPLAQTDSALDELDERGIRYVTLSHSRANALSDSSYDIRERWGGLSDFGREMVHELSRRGIMVDVSHISDKAFWDVLDEAPVPVIASHSSARHFTPGWQRNMSDEMIRAIAAEGGVVQISWGSIFLTREPHQWASRRDAAIEAEIEAGSFARRSEEAAEFRAQWIADNPYPFATLDDVLDHYDHIVNLVGVEYVGIGSDYDGVGDTLPVGLKDVSTYPNLIAGLLERGYDEAEIRLILGENLMRVWSAVEAYAMEQGNEVACIGH
jgi:membrane dipeptidase